MADRTIFEVRGLRETQAALNALERKVQKKILRSAMRDAMKDVAKLVRGNVPVGKDSRDHKGGALKKSVKVRAGKGGRKAIIISVLVGEPEPNQKRKSSGQFQGKAYYGRFPEEGTETQPAQHFMKRSYDQGKGPALSRVIRDVRYQVTFQAWRK